MDRVSLLELFCMQKYVHQYVIKSWTFIKNNYDNSKKLRILKHLEGDSVSIDLLIGNDFYYS